MKKAFLLLLFIFTVILLVSCSDRCSHLLMSETVIPPDCSNEGKTVNQCLDCSYSYYSDFVAPTGHTLAVSTTLPNCTDSGQTVYSCECGYSYSSDFAPPSGHEFEVVQDILPTCLAGGHKLNVCATCGYSYKSDYIFYSDIINSAFSDNSIVLAKGIDVSVYQHTSTDTPLDWNAIKAAGFEFVILKAGSTVRNGGTKGGIEPTFEMDYRDAKAAGLEVGAYFYTYANSTEDILKDADALLQYIEGKQFEYPIYLDMEEESQKALSKSMLGEMCAQFIAKLQSKGYYAALYLNNDWFNTVYDKIEVTALFDLWYSRYPGTDIPVWNQEKYGNHLGMWQFTNLGTIDGIKDITFDFNYAYRDYPSIMKKWGLNGY